MLQYLKGVTSGRMYSNQYQMDSYPQDQQEQGHYPSQQQYNQPKRGVASQPRNYPRMDAPQSNAPDGQYNANYNTAVVTQQPGVVSKRNFFLFVCLKTFILSRF